MEIFCTLLEDGNIRVHPNEAEAFDLEPNQVLSNYVCLKVRKIPAVRTWMHEKNDKCQTQLCVHSMNEFFS